MKTINNIIKLCKIKFLKYPIIIILLTIGFTLEVTGQQSPVYSQYMWNDFAINPSVAGTQNYFKIQASVRNQWTRIDDHPVTMNVAMYGPLKNYNMGYGGSIFYDQVGPESKMKIAGAYSYNMQLAGFWRISGGLALGLMQYKLDGTRLDFGENNNDPAVTGAIESMWKADGSVGISVYNHQYFFGFSVHNLFGNKFDFYDEGNYSIPDTTLSEPTGVSKLKQNFYLVGNMKISLNRDFFVQPTVMIKSVFPDQFQAELGGIVTWKKKVWGGITFRTSDAVVVMVGYNHEGRFNIGLSYDITYSAMRQYSGGAWEVLIGYSFQKVK